MITFRTLSFIFGLAAITGHLSFCANLDHTQHEAGAQDHKHESKNDIVESAQDYPYKHQREKAQSDQGKWKVVRKRTRFGTNSEERDWDFFDNDDINSINDDDLEVEWKEYPYHGNEVEYHSHPHEHPHYTHEVSSVYSKYEKLRPIDLTKLVPMISLVGLYMLTPTYLNARKKRSTFRISSDGIDLTEEDKKFECFVRLACRVEKLSAEVGVPGNPLVKELMENRRFAEMVRRYKDSDRCNTAGCSKVLTSA